MKIIFALIPSLLCFCTGLFFYARHTDPGPQDKILTVKEVKESASSLDKSDTRVTLEGVLTEQISPDTYWFEDATGRIEAELEDSAMVGFVFDPSVKVRISGEVDYDVLEGSEIEVEQIQIVKQ